MKELVFLNLHVLAYHVVVFRALIKRGCKTLITAELLIISGICNVL